MRVVVLTASPRPDGNSTALARACARGASVEGHDVRVEDLNRWAAGGFLRDCRLCRDAAGACTIPDAYSRLVRDVVAPADALVLATPLYFYGVAAVLKNAIDRLVCHLGDSCPDADAVIDALAGQRCALLVSSEEDYPSLLAGVTVQVQELCRYLRQDFVDVVHGVGNRRGEVSSDPGDPLEAASRLGAELFTRRSSDYTVVTERARAVW